MLTQTLSFLAAIGCAIKKKSMRLLVRMLMLMVLKNYANCIIDDYRLTAAISLLKVLFNQLTSQCSSHRTMASQCSTPINCSPPSRPQSRTSSQLNSSCRSTPTAVPHKVVPEVAFSLAVQAAEYFVGFEEHYDIDSETSLVSCSALLMMHSLVLIQFSALH